MIKIIFNRKNKTLHSCFVTKSVLKILEENYKTYCSLNSELPEGDLNMKKKVEEVLSVEDFGSKRGAKMDQDDFLLYVYLLALLLLCLVDLRLMRLFCAGCWSGSTPTKSTSRRPAAVCFLPSNIAPVAALANIGI
jgi:hypothetical protein